MAKTLTKEAKKAHPEEDATSHRKKQAKQEAKLMLGIEQARKDVMKAEQKVTKAQGNLESSTKQLHDLEQELNKMRTPKRKGQHDSAELTANEVVGHNGSQGSASHENVAIPIPTDQVAEQQPVEGRTDILQSTTDSGQTEETQTVSPTPVDIAPAEGREDISLPEADTAQVSTTQMESPTPVDAASTETQPEQAEHHENDAEGDEETASEHPRTPRRSSRRTTAHKDEEA